MSIMKCIFWKNGQCESDYGKEIKCESGSPNTLPLGCPYSEKKLYQTQNMLTNRQVRKRIMTKLDLYDEDVETIIDETIKIVNAEEAKRLRKLKREISRLIDESIFLTNIRVFR